MDKNHTPAIYPTELRDKPGHYSTKQKLGRQETFLQAYIQTQDKDKALKAANISDSCYRNWLSLDEDFKGRFSRVMFTAVPEAVERIRFEIVKGDWKAAQFVLQAASPALFDPGVRKQLIANQGAENIESFRSIRDILKLSNKNPFSSEEDQPTQPPENIEEK